MIQKDGVFEGIIDEDILLVKGLRKIGNLSFLNFPVPFFQDVKEKSEFLMLTIDCISIEFLELKIGILFFFKKLSNLFLNCLLISIYEDVLQICTVESLFHIEI